MIELRSVEKRYGSVMALRGLDLTVPVGSVFGLIGPNGAGKTTAMLILSSLLARDGGSVAVAGADPEREPNVVRRHLGYMPDFFGFYESLNAYEYLEFFAAVQGVPAARRRGVVLDLLALVDLAHKADADVNSLSRGMKQRLSLARTLVHDPQLLVLDEPASGLDPRARVQLRELIAELHRMGKTILISSHILSELEGICTHMGVIDEGVVKAQGDMEAIRNAFTGSRRVRIRLADEDVDRALDLLGARPEVSEASVERQRLDFVFAGDDDTSAGLLAELIRGGVTVYEWRMEAAGLEELFLQLTQEEEETR
ncbi:MAG TPA: ABC transporter ATP-binding protein [Acidimicrobiia bacterium]|nr:ABC transporter ATP-binding protein [Acidimicrobiia bacterium]